MTDDAQTNEPYPDLRYATVEAFIDGEPVDPEALKDALADPAARDHLVDLLVLRKAVRTMPPLAVSAAHPRSPRSRNRAGWLAAAAAVVVSLTAGYLTGHRAIPPATAHADVEATIDFGSVPVAPAPTHVVALRPGVNWTDSQEGR
jgi:hypothetical protein